MALTAKERKQRQLERERAALRQLEDSTYPHLHMPFFEWLATNPNWSSVTLELELAGFEPPAFEDDLGPEAYVLEGAISTEEDLKEAFPGAKGSVGRAEEMVDRLLNSAVELAALINRYKEAELSARRKEIEDADLSAPEVRKKALGTIAQITRIEAELKKNVRRTLPQWKIRGV